MNYKETLEYLYKRTPAFYIKGAEAYKPGLEVSRKLDDMAGNPHLRFRSIHIAGTNGKGSVAHLIAAVLQASGHRVGLYTSPHLVDFCERIRVNGHPITHQYIIDFVNKNIKFIEKERPSFFELTTSMAFDYFRHKKVNFAVIETGLGGRLDCTNIISPIVSIITSIGLDHTDLLGNTVQQIAHEKAGIIKSNVPVVIGELEDDELTQIFVQKATEVSAPVILSSLKGNLLDAEIQRDGSWIFESADYGRIVCELRGLSQKYNTKTVLAALKVLAGIGVQIRIAAVRKAFQSVTEMTGLMGRWHQVNTKPKIVCDIGHNIGAWQMNMRQLYFEASKHDKVHIVYGASSDKDVESILRLMPKTAYFYYTQAGVQRAMPVESIATLGALNGLDGKPFTNVRDAVMEAIDSAAPDDFILIGGSAFVVAEAFHLFPNAVK
jgi:dihydrofolate synthase/folylpolyglutamate synthase